MAALAAFRTATLAPLAGRMRAHSERYNASDCTGQGPSTITLTS
jgi:hypothetical protein